MRARRRLFWRLRPRIVRALPFLIVLLAGLPGVHASERVRIGGTQASLLVWVAQETGLFRKHGIEVETQMFSSGVAAAEALIRGEIDLATVSDTVVAVKAAAHPELRILSSISAVRTARLVGRRDRGISDARSLAGKTVAMTAGSVSEFFLSRYLTLHGVDAGAVTVVDLKPEKIAQGLVAGTLDAGLTWAPFITDAEDELKANAVLLPGQVDQFYFFLLITANGWLGKHPQQAEAMLRALIEAETLCSEQPEKAKEIIQKKMGYRTEFMERLWPLNSLHVSLPQALIFNLEVQANWSMKKNTFPGAKLPNFLDHVVTEPLAGLRSDSVGIVK